MNKMIILSFLITLNGCGYFFRNYNDEHIINIKNARNPYSAVIRLNSSHASWEMNVVENTLNDTAMLGVMKISPGKKGLLFRTECFADSIPINYKPYKATNGTLVLSYSSY